MGMIKANTALSLESEREIRVWRIMVMMRERSANGCVCDTEMRVLWWWWWWGGLGIGGENKRKMENPHKHGNAVSHHNMHFHGIPAVCVMTDNAH